LSPDPMWQSRT